MNDLIDKKRISEVTQLNRRDIQYIADKFFTPRPEIRRRGRKLRFTEREVAVFGVIGELKKYGMTFGAIMGWVERISVDKKWLSLFDGQDAMTSIGIIDGKVSVVFVIFDANIDTIKIHLIKSGCVPAFNPCGNKNSMLAVNITKSLVFSRGKLCLT